MAKRMAIETHLQVRMLAASGMCKVDVARAIGCHVALVRKLLKRFPKPPRKRAARALSIQEREEIGRGIAEDLPLSVIARQLGRARSTISREVKKQGRNSYRAWRGEDNAERLAARPKKGKLESNLRLGAEVEDGLTHNWSPEQISKRLRVDHVDDPAMHLSHETIYKAIYVQGRGSLRKELARHLRSKRTRRKPRTHKEPRGKIRDMVNISERPAEVADRAVPGHWEGDLIIGKGNLTCIGTLVERTTRFVMLLFLPKGGTAQHVREVLTKKIQTLPAVLQRSLTWDQGHELAQHATFTVDTGVNVFFCDPHSPWQRGSNENTNGLLRQYFPKGTDLSQYDEAHLDYVANELNGRPRKTLGWKKPTEALNELLR
jgi:IS30 family transposase